MVERVVKPSERHLDQYAKHLSMRQVDESDEMALSEQMQRVDESDGELAEDISEHR